MVDVVGVRFKRGGHIYYFSPGKESYQYDEQVVVETKQCLQIGLVAIPDKQLSLEDLPDELQPILRKVQPADIKQENKNEHDAKQAFATAKKKIHEHQLEMKLIDVEYTFDRNKMIFYFTADGRIDFRELVKDLAAVFRTRIELRQIGVRDEAKELGGIGPCGRMLCCSTFLGDFVPVSIKMAKDQNLSLNPTKISGLCGRLMCCLNYENDWYAEAKRAMPDLGVQVTTPDGAGRIVGLNLMDRIVKVRLLGRETPLEYLASDIQVIEEGQTEKKGPKKVKVAQAVEAEAETEEKAGEQNE